MNQLKLKSDNSEEKFTLTLFPIVGVMLLIPLIVRIHIYDPILERYPWYAISNNQTTDFFLYYKSIFITIVLVLMAIILLGTFFINRNTFCFQFVYIPLGIYGLCIIVSTFFSIDKEFSIHGITEQFEPVWALLAYICMTYYASIFINSEKKINFIIKCWMIMLGILCLIGVGQILGFDPMASSLVKRLIIPNSLASMRDTISFVFGKHRVYLTLYNPNYVGMLASLAFPVFAVFLLFSKTLVQRLINTGLLIGLAIAVIGSQSKNAIVVLAIVFVIGLILLRERIKKIWKWIVFTILGMLALGLLVDGITGFSYSKSILGLFKHSSTSPPALTAIATNDDNVEITYQSKKMVLEYTISNNQLFLTAQDENGLEIKNAYVSDSHRFLFDQAPFDKMMLTLSTVDGKLSLLITEGEKIWPISNQFEDGSYRTYNSVGKWDKVTVAKSADIFKETSFSGRGYLWNRTIPILRDYLVIGSGPDTYTLVYPQQDYVNLYNNGYDGTFASKPHNMYLQIAVQTGCLSILAVIVFYAMYLIQSIRLYWKSCFDTRLSIIGIALFLGTLGYMISGLTNDSTVTVAPMFWVLIGMGISTNALVRKQCKAKKDDSDNYIE